MVSSNPQPLSAEMAKLALQCIAAGNGPFSAAGAVFAVQLSLQAIAEGRHVVQELASAPFPDKVHDDSAAG